MVVSSTLRRCCTALGRSLQGQGWSRCGSTCYTAHSQSHLVQSVLLCPKAASVLVRRWKFTYSPEAWAEEFPIAKQGLRQSPIDIDTSLATYSEKLAQNPLSISYKTESTIEASNTGMSFMVTCKKPSELKGGPLQDTYRLEQFHFHWGARDDRGSEHTLNGKTYAAELHLVHWNADKYAKFAEAADKPDGLAVLGAFLQVGKKHPDFDVLAQAVERVRLKNNHSSIPTVFHPASILPKNTSRYWTYPGSLTTPPLFESVTWIVFEEVVEVSKEQLEALRSLCFDHEGDCIVDNFRRPLPLGNRILSASFQ